MNIPAKSSLYISVSLEKILCTMASLQQRGCKMEDL